MYEHSAISPQLQTTLPAVVNDAVKNHRQDENRFFLQQIPVQCKLSVGAVDDPLEHEADAMADKVMRMPEQNFIQRKCAHCEEEEKAQRKPLQSFIQKNVRTVKKKKKRSVNL